MVNRCQCHFLITLLLIILANFVIETHSCPREGEATYLTLSPTEGIRGTALVDTHLSPPSITLLLEGDTWENTPTAADVLVAAVKVPDTFTAAMRHGIRATFDRNNNSTFYGSVAVITFTSDELYEQPSTYPLYIIIANVSNATACRREPHV
eukprot:PhF_6_TR29291/c1_g1_i3/m.42932